MRWFCCVLLALCYGIVRPGPADGAEPARKPNILLILVDDKYQNTTTE